METKVHCMGDSCWRTILNEPGFPLVLKQVNGQVVSGCVNWLGLDKLNCRNGEWGAADVTLQQLVVVSFDLREEEFRLLSLPEGVSCEVPHDESNLGVLRNCLCLFHDHKRTHFVVWQMREYGVRESWTRLVSVSYEHLRCDGFPSLRPLMSLSEDGGDILLLVTYQDMEAVTIMYNLKDNSVKCIQLPNNKPFLNDNEWRQRILSFESEKDELESKLSILSGDLESLIMEQSAVQGSKCSSIPLDTQNELGKRIVACCSEENCQVTENSKHN
ncbi:F-box/kelch-repeat protein At3g06240-like [Lotus japonicus]|uniref:F-box/kelch-repeat protein At3g06240-like n=1 Tax=Lotus japonicus TaxID=34305 RepID=UPI00258A8847|nr:F-box/kelch-repeat protein At3g06240-like [Lotus japonicus]